MKTSVFSEIVQIDNQNISLCRLPWHQLENKEVVVTGASGFLGGSIIRFLLSLYPSGLIANPLRVKGIIRSKESDLSSLETYLDNDCLQIEICDLSKVDTINLGSPDYVIHAASHASPKYYSLDPVGILLSNSAGTSALLSASNQSTRFLFISSSEVYGLSNSDHPIAESDFGSLDPTVLRSCYSEAKRFGESLVTCWHRQHGLHTNIVRPFHTYGPGLRANDGRVFSDFAYSVALRKNITLTSSGSAVRAFCYASDAVSGIMHIMLSGKSGEAYNLANPNAVVSIKELADILSSFYNVPINMSQPDVNYIPSSFSKLIPNVDKLMSLGWRPTVGIEEGFNRFIKAISI